LSDICINECSLTWLIDSHLGYEVLLKHKFEISYKWKRMWVIVIYEAEQNNDKKGGKRKKKKKKKKNKKKCTLKKNSIH
jgi:hypothetical protein